MTENKFRTLELAKQFYRDCQNLKFTGAKKDQFDRALLSVVLNLAEGNVKPTTKDRRKFFFTALGSLKEVQAILDLSDEPSAMTQSSILGAHLYRLCQRVK